MWKRIDPSLRLFAVGLAALLIFALTEVWAALSAQSVDGAPAPLAAPIGVVFLLLGVLGWMRLARNIFVPAQSDTILNRMPPFLRWIAVAIIFGFIEWVYLLSPPSSLLAGSWTQFLFAVGFAGLISEIFMARRAPPLDAGGFLLALFLFLYPRMVSDALLYFPDPRVLAALVAAGFIPLFALISILFLAPGAKLHAALLSWRARLGRGRWLLAILLIAAPLIVRYGVSTGFYILCPNIRFALLLAVALGAAYLLGSDPRRLITAGPFIRSAGTLVLVSAVTQALLFVSADPFSLSWSEGNRLYDYSLVFGQDLYEYNGTIPDPYNTPGRYGLWGVLYLLPGLPIWVHRLWNMILLTLPSLLLAWFLTRRLAPDDLRIGLFLWISAFFIVLAPLHPPFMITAIIVAAFAFHRSPAFRAGSLIVASLYAGISRWTWVLAPGIWGGLIDLLLYYPARKGTWFQRLLPTAAMTACGVLPGLLLNLSNITAFSTGAMSTANQPLLWNRLLPNPTLGPGVLLLLLWTVGPLVLLLVHAMWTRRWRLDMFQGIAVSGAMLGFLTSGLLISAKIGGGGDLHNLDMFLVTLMFIMALGLIAQPTARTSQSWPVWAVASVLYLAILPAYPFTPFSPSAGTHAWLDFPLPQESTRALEIIQSQVAEASPDGEVLFMDQRQLLTFGYIRGVPFVPEYEKKYMMDQALASNAAYFQPYYADLAAKRFALIVTEPLKTDLKGTEGIFAEENDLWVIYVSIPTLCYYKPIMTDRAVDVQLLVPRANPSCEAALPGAAP